MTIGRIPSVEGGIQPTIVDAKGDLIAATANDTPARLAVGTNNFFLRANSSASTGLEWAGSVTTFTPVLNQNGNVATSTATGKYLRVGNFIYGTVFIVANANGTANNKVRVTLPLAAVVNNVFIPVGQGAFYDASSFNVYPVQVVVEDGTYFSFPVTNAILGNGLQYLGGTQFTAALAAADQFGFSFAYEVA
jgi:hypothetical protein